MADRSKGPEHIKNLLGRFIRKNKLRGKIGAKEIYAIWPEAVGADIASHTRITAFRRGVLSVAVDSAAHFYELSTFFGDEIKEKLNQHGLKIVIVKINFHLD